jgi:PhnB protein
MHVIPYLYFNGRCEEALEFYKKVFGAKVEALMRFKENPQAQYNPLGAEEKVMHACVRIGDSTLMASDGMCQGQSKFEGISLSVNAATITEAERLFAALGDGGKVQMPLAETFFSPRFGMVADKFGVSWMVIVEKK